MRDDFKPIPNFEGYIINTEGVVISHKQSKRRVITPNINNQGYPMIRLCREGVKHTFLIHRLVWIVFNGKIPKGLVVLHGPGNDKSNANLEYLSLGTNKENHGRDRIRDGTINRGARNSNSKLTVIQVKYIKERLNDGMQGKVLAKLFDIGEAQVSRIKRGERWAHISD